MKLKHTIHRLLLHSCHGLELSLTDNAVDQRPMCLLACVAFWTYLVTINLFFVYLMNSTRDAAANNYECILEVWSVMFHFHKVVLVRYLVTVC